MPEGTSSQAWHLQQAIALRIPQGIPEGIGRMVEFEALDAHAELAPGELRMTVDNSPVGRITISSRAIATIASRAALGTYGVVGMSSRNFADGIAQRLVRDPHRGIEIRTDAGQVRIDAYIIVEYGTRVSSVAHSVANNVRYQVEQMLGMTVADVSVHVQDLRVSSID